MTHGVLIYGSGPHRYLRPDLQDPIKVADPTHRAGTLRPTTRPAGSVCSLPIIVVFGILDQFENESSLAFVEVRCQPMTLSTITNRPLTGCIRSDCNPKVFLEHIYRFKSFLIARITRSLADPSITTCDPLDKLLSFCGRYDIVRWHRCIVSAQWQ